MGSRKGEKDGIFMLVFENMNATVPETGFNPKLLTFLSQRSSFAKTNLSGVPSLEPEVSDQ